MFLSLHFLVLYFIAGIPSLHMFTRGVPATPVNRIVLSQPSSILYIICEKKSYYIISKRLPSSRTMVVDIISWNQY